MVASEQHGEGGVAEHSGHPPRILAAAEGVGGERVAGVVEIPALELGLLKRRVPDAPPEIPKINMLTEPVGKHELPTAGDQALGLKGSAHRGQHVDLAERGGSL